MKTTLEISDPLLRQARKIAAQERTTLRELVERGLRRVVAEHGKPKKKFKLRDVSFGGNGLQPEWQNESWDDIRDMIYGDRG